jgi:hypothetical protein
MPSRTLRVHNLLPTAALVTLTLIGGTALPDTPAVTTRTLIDEAKISDLLVDYYADVDHGSVNFKRFYVPAGTLDVNGLVAHGPAEIAELYRKTYQSEREVAAAQKGVKVEQLAPSKGAYHLLITNQKIVVSGKTATADLIWTITVDPVPTERPVMTEQGREHDELVEQNGQWLLKTRMITSDAGLQGIFVAPYQKR